MRVQAPQEPAEDPTPTTNTVKTKTKAAKATPPAERPTRTDDAVILRLIEERNEAREQRDRLEEAVEQMMTYRPNGLSEDQHEVGVWNDLAAALAAVKGGPQ